MDYRQYGYNQDPKLAGPSVHPIPTPTVQPQYQTLAPSTTWRRGAFRRFPWPGFLALVAALLSAIGMVVVLVLSNNKPVSQWKISPAVYLAIESTIANILLAYALSEGTTVAWWVKSMKPGSHVSDLHNIWAYGTSIKQALFSGRGFNLIALACITAALAPINGPLLQRASTISTLAVNKPTTLTVLAAQEFPLGYTGTVTGRAHTVGFVTSNFSSVVQDYVLKKPINITQSGCEGRCSGVMQAAGYAINCSYSILQYNLSSSLAINPDRTTNDAVFSGTNVFSTNFTYYEMTRNPTINYSSVHKTDGECAGDLHLAQCTLTPALLQYNVILDNDTISLDPKYTYKDDRLVKYTPSFGNDAQGPSTHGGMYLALSTMFNSQVRLSFGGAVGYILGTSGAPALQYAVTGLTVGMTCPTYWSDPTDDMLSTARELAFRVAIHAANSTNATNTQTISATSVDVLTVYVSHYLYLGLAVFFTLLSTLCIAPTFFGWWALGRKVSLSPIEIAKAFDAPILSNSLDSNLDADDLLKEVGDRPVRYGALGEQVYAHNGVLVGRTGEKLVMGEPGRVHEAAEGRTYGG
ncbi:uncharacterized protein BP5553_09018 [Venustampulla echinocandica]|uniref:Uncharacterized protein n=1 Tax=Venustampulla echinocandica TaxID=2656787 RepID=A0A370TDN3_9HELO|nr:uncharacterized protein BP5553_09018 [Venustampulla echinocandica]RDL32562.1 hypothetical protein BP5553_09018 [Venustampulla echinocandica]